MAVITAKTDTSRENGRRLKAHKKSRQGCGNCKLRKVKCDEIKPSCKKCQVYGTFCDYDSRHTDLQPSARGARTGDILRTPVCSENQLMLGVINSISDSLSPASSPRSSTSSIEQYQFSVRELEVLCRFHERTIISIGPSQITQIYQRIYTSLTYSHVFLLHTVLTLTLVHDQYLGIGSWKENTTAIAYHWSRAAALLNERLSANFERSERDALWACAALLGALAFSNVEANTAEEVWPLDPASNLEWLRLTEGKKEIWRISDPMREDSIFSAVMPDFMQYSSPNAASMTELEKLPPALFRMCQFADTSLHQENPYYGPASVIAQTLDIECSRDTIGRFLSLFGCMTMEYKRLLHLKDPCALSILGYWYAKLCHCQLWYSWRRAYLESQAICKYLLRNHHRDETVVSTARDIQTKCAAEKPWRPPSQMHADVRTIRSMPGWKRSSLADARTTVVPRA